MKKLYTITEIFETNEGMVYTTTNNQIKDAEEAKVMFESRTAMMLQTPNVKVLSQQYQENEFGFTKVELPDGSTIEIAMLKLVLV